MNIQVGAKTVGGLVGVMALLGITSEQSQATIYPLLRNVENGIDPFGHDLEIHLIGELQDTKSGIILSNKFVEAIYSNN